MFDLPPLIFVSFQLHPYTSEWKRQVCVCVCESLIILTLFYFAGNTLWTTKDNTLLFCFFPPLSSYTVSGLTELPVASSINVKWTRANGECIFSFPLFSLSFFFLFFFSFLFFDPSPKQRTSFSTMQLVGAMIVRCTELSWPTSRREHWWWW